MICARKTRQRGFLVITVLLILGVIAAIALMLSASTALDNVLVKSQNDRHTLDYIAESGMEHAKWQLARNSSCSGYQNLPTTPFAGGSYAATVTPTDNSPVSINATGTLTDGTTRNLTLNGVTVYDRAIPATGLLMPGDEGKDTFIEGESGHRNHNKANDNELEIDSRSGREKRILLEFDLSSLPATALIQTAVLRLELKNAGSADVVTAHRLLRPWTEDGVTWDSYDGANAWDTPGGDYDPSVVGSFMTDSTGSKSLDISDLARAWVDGSLPNVGIVLIAAASGSGGENKFDSSDSNGNSRPTLQLTYVCECGTVCTGMGSDNTVVLSTDNQATLRGVTFDNVDIATYNPADDSTTLLLTGALTSLNRRIDAVHVLSSGRIVLSTTDDATLGGLSFEADDLVEYDVLADTATMYFDGSLHFSAGENITSLHILNNDNLVLSTENDAVLGGVSFSAMDLVEYNPANGSATVYFDGDATTLSEKITALHILENNQLVLGAEDETTLGGISFTAADLVQYDPVTDTATTYFPGAALFDTANERVMSAHIDGDLGPEIPTTLNILYVVPNPGSLTSDEAERRTLMESWDYVVTLIDDSDSQAAFDAAAMVNDVVYVAQEILSGEIGTKLSDLPIGVVDEEQQLFDELGFGGAYTSDHSMQIIDVVDNAHEITSVFASGDLTITSNGQSMHYLSAGLSPDLTVLAVYPSSSYPILAVLDAGDALYGGGNAAGRRAWLPWGGNIFEFSRLNADGRLLMRRTIEWTADSASAFGPLAHWKLDDNSGTAAIDSEGGHTGTLVNDPTWSSSGRVGGALVFDGDDDYVRVSDSGDFHLAEGSVQAWIKADTTSTEQNLFYKDGSDKFYVSVKDGEIAYETGGDTVYGSIQANQWYLVTVSFGADGMKLYLNSNLVGSSTKTDAIVDNSEDLYIGADDSADKAFSGTIDEVRIYDRALSAAEIADLFMMGASGGSGGSGGSCSGTFRDEFNDVAFTGNDGSLNWATDWIEIGESNGAGGGDIFVTTDQSNNRIRIRDNDSGGEGVEREADLSGASLASISYDYRRMNLDSSGDYVSIEISANGNTGPWTEVARPGGPDNDANYRFATHDISAFASSNTRVRFVTSPSMGPTDTVWFDNIEIECVP